MYEDVEKKTQELIINYLNETNSLDSFIQLVEQYDKRAKTKKGETAALARKMKSEINNALDEACVSGLIMKKLGQIGLSKDQASIDSLMGYTRRVFIEVLNGLGKSQQILSVDSGDYIKSFKGYHQEKLAVDVIKKYAKEMGHNLGVKQMGSSKQNNIQVEFDIILGSKKVNRLGEKTLLNKYIDMLDQITSFSVMGETPIEDVLLTAQSKSWIMPDTERIKPSMQSSRLYFGGNAGIRPTGTDAYYWHAGLYNAMINLTDVLGPTNALYVTGNEIAFTVDILQRFKDMNYVFAFNLNKDHKISSNTVYAMSHNDK